MMTPSQCRCEPYATAADECAADSRLALCDTLRRADGVAEPGERNSTWGRNCHSRTPQHTPVAKVAASCRARGAYAREHGLEGQDAGVRQCAGMFLDEDDRIRAGALSQDVAPES